MKKALYAAIFFIFFLIGLIVFMPYQRIYNSTINSLLSKEKIAASYKIKRAFISHLYLNNIEIYMPDKTIKVDRCKIRLNPLGFLFNSSLAYIEVSSNNEHGNFKIEKDKNRYYISGTFKTALLRSFLDSNLSAFLKGFTNKDRLSLIVAYKKDRIEIEKLEIKGDFELVAKGYIKGGIIRLMGVVKIGKIKENFSI